jgi:transposase
VTLWRRRYEERGLAGLKDRPRGGRPPRLDQAKRSEILLATLAPPPPELGITHWSSRQLARQVGVHYSTVARLWRDYGLQPRPLETFRFSTDPRLQAKVHDVVGLYLDPPDKAVVLDVGERSPIQATDRAPPALPVRPRLPVLDVATASEQRRHIEFVTFLRRIAQAYPTVKLHVVCNSDAPKERAEVSAWLLHNPRIVLHATATPGRWQNLLEVFFSIIACRAIDPDSDSLAQVSDAIRRFVGRCTDCCQPSVWINEQKGQS